MMGGWRGEEEETSDVLEVKKKKKIQKENRVEGTFKEEEGGKQKEMVKQIYKQICVCVWGGGAKIRMEVGGGVLVRPVSDNVTWHTLLILAQRRDPASPSARGQGRSLGSASHPPPLPLTNPPTYSQSDTHTHTSTDTKSNPTPPLPSSPDRHPARPACISIKQLQANLLPCRVGGVKRGVERWLALLNNGLSDEKALAELDIHYKRATPR